MRDKVTNVLVVGVGGQGTLLASRVLADVAVEQGLDVKIAETHGMAQRGGSVVTQVRFGKVVYSPLIPEGEADFLLAFEQLEALRWAGYCRPNGTAIINDQIIEPLPVLTGAEEYPSGIIRLVKEQVRDTLVIPASGIARECGNPRAANMVLLGVMAGRMEFRLETWLESLGAALPAAYLEPNRKAFLAGYSMGTGLS